MSASTIAVLAVVTFGVCAGSLAGAAAGLSVLVAAKAIIPESVKRKAQALG